tara:strand:+ start:4336 stop:4974 length:639 start_codon:yes stop_codon:yes gene_type:complete
MVEAIKAAEEIIEGVEEMRPQILRVVLQGRTPLIMHNPGSMRPVTGNATRGKVIPLPEDEAKAARYTDNGFLVFPTVGIREAMLEGAKVYRVQRRSARNYVSASVLMFEEWASLLDPKTNEPWKEDEYEIDVRRCVVQRQGVMRARARVDKWLAVAHFMYYDYPTCNLTLVRNALAEGGRSAGLGDYRINRSGWFGSFVVQDVDLIGDAPED